MSTWERAKRAQSRQLFWAFGLFAVTCALLSWRYIVTASSAPQVVTRAPLSRPKVVMFDVSVEALSQPQVQALSQPKSPDVKELAPTPLVNDALYQSLTSEKRWDVISIDERNALLDPAWTKAPATLTEALELGRETGADWALQAQVQPKDDFYRISFTLIALTPDLWEPSEEERQVAIAEGERAAAISRGEDPDAAEKPKDASAQTAGSESSDQGGSSAQKSDEASAAVKLLTSEQRVADLPPIIDFNTLDVSQLLLVEHISWVTEPSTLKDQLEKVGRLLFVKAQHRIRQKRAGILNQLKSELITPKKPKPRKLSAREREAQELSRAAIRELDDIQARLNAEYEQRQEEERIKREVLAQDAEKAWNELESISGNAGVLTVDVEVITKIKPPRGRWGLPRPLKKPRTVIKPASATWDQVTQATQNVSGVSLLEHKDKLLRFMHKYKDVPAFQSHIAEARNRFTWLNRAEVSWVKVYGHEFPIGGSLLAKDDTPVRWVNVKSFEMSISEVTNAQYKRCVDAKVCTPPHWDDGTCEVSGGRRVKRGPLPAQMRRGDMPVVCVDWDQATRYAQWVGGRLLSESEWEFAARSGDRFYLYPWGREDATCHLAVMNNGREDGCGFESMLPVCSKPRGHSSAGVCDLVGNVWEWVADSYRPSYLEIPQDGTPLVGGGVKVIRGGSFVGDRQELLSSTRGQYNQREVANIIGFRVARALTEL